MSDSVVRLDSEGTDLATVKRRFADFADAYAHLPLYRVISAAAATDDEVAAILTAASPGQARPVLLLAALHDLVLQDRSVVAARWFASVGGRAPGPGDDPWPDVRGTILDHADHLRSVVATRSTQTNEVNRAVYVAALLAAASADVPDRPVVLTELGASAGLLLGVDRYRIELTSPGGAASRGVEATGSHPAPEVDAVPDADPECGPAAGRGCTGERVLGDPASPVRCRGELRAGGSPGVGETGAWVLPHVVGRVGLDRTPVDLEDEAAVRWLEACLWPDQPERLDRFRAAVALMRADPPTMVAGDMVDDLEGVAARALAAAGGAAHLVVLSSWALTYVKRDRRGEVAGTLTRVAESSAQPVSWITAEPPGAVPGLPEVAIPEAVDTVLGLQRWREGVFVAPSVLGFAHPHGAWLSV